MRKMGHYGGFDAEEGELEQFIEKFNAIWKSKGTTRGGGGTRYALTIGIRNRLAAFEPTVATKEGTKTLYIWNLLIEDIKKIEQNAIETGLPVEKYPFYWQTTPAVLPGQIPTESLPVTRKKAEKEKRKEE